jgi:hypothetical protein
MSDGIREAFENLESDINELMVYQTSKSAALRDLELIKQVWNSRDAEISELVDVINEMQLAISDPQVSYDEMVALSIKAKRIVSHYTKTPCPECGGIGILSTPEASYDEHPDDCICDCGACNGRGYKWEKKI